jgi:hypothetical protein
MNIEKEPTVHPIFFNEEYATIGMTLRDYFAAAALQGIYANPKHGFNEHYTDAQEAYEMADAMMAVRKE